ncbi:DNA invertase [Rhodobacter capsulatus B6]|nr:DNA invertase [Rhodobacter capsulatus B6]
MSFISGIIDQGVELVVCEHPNVNTFFLHLLACFAEEERRQISERTKAALTAAKNRGTVLGRNAHQLASTRRENRRKFALENADRLRMAINEAGSISAAARWLNDQKVPTATGGRWHPQTVKNYLDSIQAVDQRSTSLQRS